MMMSIKHLGVAISKNVRPFTQTLARGMSANTTSLVDVAVNDKTGVATVTMQRPPVNGLNLELLKELSNTFDDLVSNRSRGMILTSNLPTIFSGGLDITEMYKPKMERLSEFWTSLQDCWAKLFGSPFPTASAINGHSPAGGCLLAMSTEHRVMVEGKYTIGLNETALGIVAPAWFRNTLYNTISSREAEKALTLGTLFPVQEAIKVGIIDETAANKEEAIAKCEQFLAKYAKINPLARSLTKSVCRGPILREFEETREHDLQTFIMFCNTPKVQEGLGKYMEMLKNKANK